MRHKKFCTEVMKKKNKLQSFYVFTFFLSELDAEFDVFWVGKKGILCNWEVLVSMIEQQTLNFLL